MRLSKQLSVPIKCDSKCTYSVGDLVYVFNYHLNHQWKAAKTTKPRDDNIHDVETGMNTWVRDYKQIRPGSITPEQPVVVQQHERSDQDITPMPYQDSTAFYSFLGPSRNRRGRVIKSLTGHAAYKKIIFPLKIILMCRLFVFYFLITFLVPPN
ncbi:unnamed protein product [Hymenolepis diminuta]|uniref:Uncharacterized protein n=1 Tax=Hymenolepis diminuta TaxID=6216 RepID=A0A564YPD8_HYMDI|nr:unnamed protein product [Hymenolepis diminuta]